MRIKEIYLRERGKSVGPFHNIVDAELFLRLLELYGETRADIQVVEVNADDKVKQIAVTPEERHQQLAAAAKNRNPTPEWLEAKTEIDRTLALLRLIPAAKTAARNDENPH